MRYKTEEQPKHGDMREVRRFFILPVEAKDGYTYWMQWLTVWERYNAHPEYYRWEIDHAVGP